MFLETPYEFESLINEKPSHWQQIQRFQIKLIGPFRGFETRRLSNDFDLNRWRHRAKIPTTCVGVR